MFLSTKYFPLAGTPKASPIVLKTIFIILVFGLACIPGCGKPSDKKAYEEVVSTMSMEKARRFFSAYPDSLYRDRLAGEMIEWCRREQTGDCYRLILEALPEDHARYEELAAYYAERFNQNTRK